MAPLKLILIGTFLLLSWSMALKGRKPRPEATYLALGDSYTIGEAVDPQERYPVQAGRLLAAGDQVNCGTPKIIAATGWTTADLLGAVGSDGPDGSSDTYDVVSLLIGVNNQFQGRSQAEYGEQFEVLLRRSIRLAGNKPGHVVVLSIPDYSVTPFGRVGDTALIAAQIDSFNRINAGLARRFSVNYIDVTAESRRAATDPTLIAGDGLHFSGKEYAIWARLMEPVLRNVLK